MIAAIAPWLADALVLASLVLMSIAVYGMLWMPDIYTRLQAAGKGIGLAHGAQVGHQIAHRQPIADKDFKMLTQGYGDDEQDEEETKE